MTTRVAIIGGGQMGLVMAEALVAGGADVLLWGPHADRVEVLAATRQSPDRLPGFELPEPVVATSVDERISTGGVDVIVNAVPTQYIRSVWSRIRPHVPDRATIVCVSKGIERDTLLRPTQVIAEVLSGVEAGAALRGPSEVAGSEQRMCVLSGPTIAAELAKHLPATMVAASHDAALARRVQDLFEAVRWLRVYHNDDPLGVEVAGATKNVIALAAGMIDGLRIGDNAKSALLARGLAEIARLGTAMGAQQETFFGIAGVGDLATTCFSPSGRNRACGERLGRGETLDSILQSSVHVVEGVPTATALRELATRHDVEMPIAEAVRRILFEGLSPADAIGLLMEREPKRERVG